jgi:enoyl-CoA hydratase/carnithine racemase
VIDSDCEFECNVSTKQIQVDLRPSVNDAVPLPSLLETAISYAGRIVENSPEAVQSTKRALVTSLHEGGVEEAFLKHAWSLENKQAMFGKNIKVCSES